MVMIINQRLTFAVKLPNFCQIAQSPILLEEEIHTSEKFVFSLEKGRKR